MASHFVLSPFDVQNSQIGPLVYTRVPFLLIFVRSSIPATPISPCKHGLFVVVDFPRRFHKKNGQDSISHTHEIPVPLNVILKPSGLLRTVTTDAFFTADSLQAALRHIRVSAYGCCIPALTRFTDSYCAGPRRQRPRMKGCSTDQALCKSSPQL